MDYIKESTEIKLSVHGTPEGYSILGFIGDELQEDCSSYYICPGVTPQDIEAVMKALLQKVERY